MKINNSIYIFICTDKLGGLDKMARTVVSVALSNKAYKAIEMLRDKAINISKYFEKSLMAKVLEDFKTTNNEGSY